MLHEGVRNWVIFILMLGCSIVIHEGGHWLAAIISGVRIREVGLGLPPRICTLGRWRGVLITLNWLPFGGFICPEGEFNPEIQGGLAASPSRARLAIFSAGAIANMVLAITLWTLGFSTGWPDRVEVASIYHPSPAAATGLRPHDVILAVDGEIIHRTYQLQQSILARKGKLVELTVEREGEILYLTLMPRNLWPADEGPAGFTTRTLIQKYPCQIAFQRAMEQMTTYIRETGLALYRLLLGKLSAQEARLTSLIGLKQASDRATDVAVQANAWFPILHLTAVINIALGIANMLPFPALDGGRFALVLVEILRGERLNLQCEKIIHAVGVVTLLGLTVILIIRDVFHPLI